MSLRAFVSSTFKDLEEHRSFVIAALRRAGINVDPMEAWTAASQEPKVFSQERLDGCDLCVLLVGLRRGHVPEGETRSITQLEYEAARRQGIDVLVFLLDEDAPWPRRFDELDADPEVRAWRRRLMERHGVGFFGHDPTSIEIAPALTRWVQQQREAGTGQLNVEAFPAALREAARRIRDGEVREGLLSMRATVARALAERAGRSASTEDAEPPMHRLRGLADQLPASAVGSLELALSAGGVALSGGDMPRAEAHQALTAAAAGLRLLQPLRVEISAGPRGYRFALVSDEQGVILRGESYGSKASLKNGLRSLTRNIAEPHHIARSVTKDGRHYFTVKAPNAEIVGISAFFESPEALDAALTTAQQALREAPIVDLSEGV